MTGRPLPPVYNNGNDNNEQQHQNVYLKIFNKIYYVNYYGIFIVLYNENVKDIFGMTFGPGEVLPLYHSALYRSGNDE